MDVPDTAVVVLVYSCEEDGHEYRVALNSFDEASEFSFFDADPCDRCKDYDLISTVQLDRIEFR